MPPTRRTAWASDLTHPLPLAAVALLALNDHVLKGSGLLPQAVTGKLSDFAGLFFFPLLLASLARGASLLALGRDIPRRAALALVTTTATGAVFTLLKLHAPFNAFLSRVWGVNVMDPSDLFALPVLLLSAAFLLRAQRVSRAPRRILDFAAVTAASIASIATSAQQPPPVPPPPQPVAMAKDGCAAISVLSCERSATQTYVVIEALGAGSSACAIEVQAASEIGARTTPVDMLPAPVRVDPGRQASFGLSFLRPVAPEEQIGSAALHLDLRVDGSLRSLDASIACHPR